MTGKCKRPPIETQGTTRDRKLAFAQRKETGTFMAKITLHEITVTFSDAARDGRAVETAFGPLAGLFRREPGLPSPLTPTGPPRPQALNGLNLEIRHGETMVVLGPSGCGKSTLLRVIAGLVTPNAGHVYYDDVEVTQVPPHERGIGLVFQSYALYPNMTSAENVGFFLRVRNREEEIPERIREVSRVMGIGFDRLLSKRPATLSGGERQRVAVARCIARDPKLLLFDEPLSNLDAKLRVQTRGELKRLIQRYKVTTVYVTHDQTEALALCDRVAIMNDGQVEQVGPPGFLMEHPISTMVATFLGTPPMNLFVGEIADNTFHSPTLSLDLPDNRFGDRKITLGVRAEHFALDPNGVLVGEVVLVEPLLSERVQLVYIDLPSQRIVARLPEDTRLHVGDVIRLTPHADRVHYFDSKSGHRL
jgi:multiple sugar transport system ATP-binding protein